MILISATPQYVWNLGRDAMQEKGTRGYFEFIRTVRVHLHFKTVNFTSGIHSGRSV
jgi:hypothetical protein